jgi:hypothetical protein
MPLRGGAAVAHGSPPEPGLLGEQSGGPNTVVEVVISVTKSVRAGIASLG